MTALEAPSGTPEEQMQWLATLVVNQAAAQLRAAGWHFAAVSIASRVDMPDGTINMPGASTYEVERECMPGLPSLANNLRMLAANLDTVFAGSGARQSEASYSQVVSGNTVDDANELARLRVFRDEVRAAHEIASRVLFAVPADCGLRALLQGHIDVSDALKQLGDGV